MTTTRLLLWFAFGAAIASCAHADIAPVFSFAAEPGVAPAVQMIRGTPDLLQYLPGHRGQGLYLPQSAAVSIPVTGFNPAEGTISFWFRPDWSPGDCTCHYIFEIDAKPAYRLGFRKGYSSAISPDFCYVVSDGNPLLNFHPENLFTARQWRHYALRFSASRNTMQLVVEGDSMGRSGKFSSDSKQPQKASLLLSGNACGAFDEVQIYDRWLDDAEILQVSGLRQPAAYLQQQLPPLGALSAGPKQVTYIDPATGQPATLSTTDRDEFEEPYNPANMPDLPETPHTKWAKPLAGGKVSVLFIAPGGFYDEYSMIREAAELWQRLDCDILVTNKPDPRVMSRQFDVIITTMQGHSGVWKGWEDLDHTLRAWVLQQVNSGRSGLVCTYPIRLDAEINKLFDAGKRLPSDALMRGLPVAALHEVNAKDGPFRWDKVYDLDDTFFTTGDKLAAEIVELYSGLASHKVVKLNYKQAGNYPNMGLTPDTANNSAATDAHYDWWMALAARAVLLAAGRQPTASIAAADVSDDVWRVTLEGESTTPLQLTYRARDLWGRPGPIGTIAVNSAQSISVKASKLFPRSVVDFILKDSSGKVLDWYSAAVPPASTMRLSGLSLDKPFYKQGDTIHGKFELSSATPAAKVAVYLTDHAGRRLRQTIASGNTFTLAIPRSADSLLMRIEALLYDGNTPADYRAADCPVPRETFEGFYPLMYGSCLNRQAGRWRRQFLRDNYGVRAGMHNGDRSYANLAALNLASIDYTTHLGYPSKRSDCEAFAENWDTFFPGHLNCPPEKMRPFRPLFYSLGEEHFVLMGSCPTPTANAGFRKWLQGKYTSLDQLNTLWGSKYASWDEITMLDPEIVDMQKLQFDVVRFENRRFMEKLFADRHAYLADYLHRADPQGTVGIHSGWDLWMGRGYDYWALSAGMDSMMCYGGPHNHYVRSFFSNYWGSHYHYNIGSHDNVRWHPWYMVLSGAHGLSWYTDAPQIWGAMTADLQLASDFAASGGEFKAAAEAGELLTRMKYLDDQVAIHYSQDSFQAGVSDMTWIHQRFINLFFDTNTPFRFVSYEQLALGHLLKRKPKLLVLPHSISLSRLECQAIRDYVQQGGVVWADVMPGTHDNHGRKLERSQLSDVFGGLKEERTREGFVHQSARVGKGFVILADPGNYSYDRNVGNYSAVADFYDFLCQIAQISRPSQPLRTADRHPANGIWTAAWTNGTALHLAAAKDYQLADQTPAGVTFKLNRSGHVYAMRAARYLGKVGWEFSTTLRTARGEVFTILPYQITGLSLKQSVPATRGQDLIMNVALQTRGAVGATDVNVLQVRVTGPQGQEVTALRRTVEMRGGKGTVALPLAYGDTAGRWTVKVKDLATGLTSSLAYNLK